MSVADRGAPLRDRPPKWRRVRVRRKAPPSRSKRLKRWIDKRWRRMRTWIIIGAMVIIGFVGFVSARNYLDQAAASAAAEATAR